MRKVFTQKVLILWMFLSFLNLPGWAEAYPAVGDKVTWAGEFQRVDGNSYKIQITKEVVAYDPSSRRWKVKVDALVGDSKTSDILETEDLYSPQKFQELIKTCRELGGNLEELKLKPGVYKTCKLTSKLADGTLVQKWWGDLPFGVISKTTRDTGKVASQPDLRTILAGL